MNRKDIKIGMRVVPSGRGFTKNWNLSRYIGTVKEIGQRYIKIEWDGFSWCPSDNNIMPVHLNMADQTHEKFIAKNNKR
jgi:hypothetical protein